MDLPALHGGLMNRASDQKILVYYIRRAFDIARTQGLKALWQKVCIRLKGDFNVYFGDEDNEEPPPQVSIIIPVYNALPMTQMCLESIYRETREIDFEVIVVDNGSRDGTARWLRAAQQRFPRLRVVRLKKNLGFSRAVNIGLQCSKGAFIVILNNDTLVSTGWLDKMLSIMHTDPTVGIVSPVTNYVGEGAQIDERAVHVRPDPAAVSQYAKSIAGRNEVSYEPCRLVFFCVLIRRELINRIGFLDEGYKMGNFEDDDYCLRARMAGYRLAIARNAFVYHYGSATFKLNRISHARWMEVNRKRFYCKAGQLATSLPRSFICPSQPQNIVVSVIVRTKDRPRLLQNALTSLANQTIRNFEVIVINDGGKDVSSLVASFTSFFPIHYVFFNTSRGRGAAINAGLNRAQAKWIAFLDDDDIVYPWHFESLLQAAEISDAKVIYSDYNRALFADAQSIYPLRLVGAPSWNFNRRDLLIQNHLPIHSFIFLRELVDIVGLWDESLSCLEDYEFLLRLSGVCDFYHLKKVTCEYRYYLDQVHSIVDRSKYVLALQEIYNRYPVDDPYIERARNSIINVLKEQVRMIEEIKKNAKNSGAERDVNRKIIRIVAGL